MLSDCLNDDSEIIARRISKLLLGEKKPVALCQIQREFNDIGQSVLNSVINGYQNHFQVFQEPWVKLVTKIDFCKTHCSKGKICPGTQPHCTGLHICKYYTLSGKCRFGKKCTFGHDLKTDHNKKILHDNLLADITVDDLKYLLALEENRTSLTMPRICKFYNVDRDKCKHTGRGSTCPNLHICKRFVENTCKFRETCHRCHNILEERNKAILSKHGINVYRNDTEIVEDLRKALFGNGNRVEGSARRSTELNKETLTNLKSETASKTVSLKECKTEVLKKEDFSTSGNDPRLRVNVVADSVHFRYMSEIKAIEKKKKTRRISLADVLLDNYTGYSTIIAYCVDDSDKVHPFYLYGDSCKDGVYVKSCKFEKGTTVELQGVFVCTPKLSDYQSCIESTLSSLGLVGISVVQKCENGKKGGDERTVDRQSVYLKLIALLESPSRELSVMSTPLQNKKNSKTKDSQLDDARSFGQKRASDGSEDNDAKRRRKSIVNSPGDCKPGIFQRHYSRQDSTHAWGNFIDTSGYQESALTWKAQGDALHSVCMIHYPGGCATGFRVGNTKHYIMTAAHVYDFILESQHGRVGGWSQNTLGNPDVFAIFDYLKEGEVQDKKKFYFKDKFLFKNNELDTLVLELEDHLDGIMPPPFKNFQQPDFTKEFFFIGHSEGRPLAINKVNKIVNMQGETAKQDIINIRRSSLQHTECPEYPDGRKYDQAPYLTVENPHRHLFHCKFSRGASGSPGLVFLNNGLTAVVSMLLCGYPIWYYDPNMEHFRTNWPKEQNCVEQGVNIASVHHFMLREKPELCKDIFG